jgi:D-aminoacyl-tRNA deacylase
MRIVVQRVKQASVSVSGDTAGQIGRGLLVLLGVARGDGRSEADYLLRKLTELRIFPDDAGKMNLSVKEAGGALLLVSQFTLYADCRRGRRPGFDRAAAPDQARELYEYFVQESGRSGVPVATGVFQAHMEVSLVNDGPVTIIIDSPDPPANAEYTPAA